MSSLYPPALGKSSTVRELWISAGLLDYWSLGTLKADTLLPQVVLGAAGGIGQVSLIIPIPIPFLATHEAITHRTFDS